MRSGGCSGRALSWILALSASLLGACGGDGGGGIVTPSPEAPQLQLLAGTADAGGRGFADGRGDAARLSSPGALAIDGQGTVYVADAGNGAIRRLSPEGDVSTLYRYGNDLVRALAVAPSGELYLVLNPTQPGRQDPGWVLQALSADGRTVRTVLDPALLAGGGDGRPANVSSIAIAGDGRLFLAGHCEVWSFEAGRLRVLASTQDLLGGERCSLFSTGHLALDAAGNLYAAFHTSMVRIASDGSRSRRPRTVFGAFAVDALGAVYGAGRGGAVVRDAPDGSVTTLAGGGLGWADGPANPGGITQLAVVRDAQGRIYASDTSNHSIRRIDLDGRAVAWAGRPDQTFFRDGPGAQARFGLYSGPLVAAPDGTLYMGESESHVIRRIGTDGTFSTWSGQAGKPGQTNGPRSEALLNFISSLALEPTGDLVLGGESFALRRVKSNGTVEAAGQVPAQLGVLRFIRTLPDGSWLMVGENAAYGFDGDSNSWFDFFVRSPSGEDRHVFNSTSAGFDGKGPPAGLGGVAVSPEGRIFFSRLHAVYELTGSNRASLIAGSPTESGRVDGVGAAARFDSIRGLVFDGEGRLYVADTANHLVRRIARDGTVSTFLGRPGVAGLVTGPLPGGLDSPTDLVVTPQGLVVRSKQALLRVPLQ
jgi:hypothetical protein